MLDKIIGGERLALHVALNANLLQQNGDPHDCSDLTRTSGENLRGRTFRDVRLRNDVESNILEVLKSVRFYCKPSLSPVGLLILAMSLSIG